jgi:signal transduction histidine kinase
MVELSSEKIVGVVIVSALGAALLVFFLAWALIRYYQSMAKKQYELLTTMIETQEKERLRIARDMHDNFGNLFATIQAEITTLQKIQDISRMQTSFNFLSQNIEIARKELRNNVSQLAPGSIKEIEWLDELKKFKNILSNPNFVLNIEVFGQYIIYTELSQTNLYRICQELINNTLKYAKATQVDFFITFTETHLELQFCDNGVGFVLDDKMQSGFGFKSIQARTDAMQGKCKCLAKLGDGTRWNFSFPHKNLIKISS